MRSTGLEAKNEGAPPPKEGVVIRPALNGGASALPLAIDTLMLNDQADLHRCRIKQGLRPWTSRSQECFLELDQNTGAENDFACAQVRKPVSSLAIAGGGIGAAAHAASR